jgi:hypothetical protein
MLELFGSVGSEVYTIRYYPVEKRVEEVLELRRGERG